MFVLIIGDYKNKNQAQVTPYNEKPTTYINKQTTATCTERSVFNPPIGSPLKHKSQGVEVVYLRHVFVVYIVYKLFFTIPYYKHF